MENDNINVPAEQPVTDTDNIAVRDAEAVLKKNQELLKELTESKRKLKAYEGLDPDKAKQALDALADLEQEKLIRKGEFDKALETRTKAYEDRLETINREKQQIITNLTAERLRNHLIASGVMPNKVELAARFIERDVELVNTDNGFELRKAGGIGDATEFSDLVKTLLSQYPDLVASDLIVGSGAPPVNNATAATGRKWADLSRNQKAAAIRDAGGDIETAKAAYK